MVRILIAGLAAGLGMNLAMLATFRLIGFGWNGGGILMNPSVQSEKLIAVWTKLEPLPLVINNPLPIVIGILFYGIVLSAIYVSIRSAWPTGTPQRGLRFAALLFLVSFLFWEFFTPFNQFGEPLRLIALELVFWAVIAATCGLTLAAVHERHA